MCLLRASVSVIIHVDRKKIPGPSIDRSLCLRSVKRRREYVLVSLLQWNHCNFTSYSPHKTRILDLWTACAVRLPMLVAIGSRWRWTTMRCTIPTMGNVCQVADYLNDMFVSVVWFLTIECVCHFYIGCISDVLLYFHALATMSWRLSSYSMLPLLEKCAGITVMSLSRRWDLSAYSCNLSFVLCEVFALMAIHQNKRLAATCIHHFSAISVII